MRTKFHTLIPVLTILVAVGGIPHARGEDPNHSSAQESNPLDRLREYREKGELEKMLVYAEEQMRNYPYETEMIQDELVSGYEAHYQLYKLINYFQERLKNDPMAVHPYKVLGQVFQRQEKTARALEMYGKAAVLYQIWINRLLIRRRSPLSLILEKELVAFRSGTGISSQ